MAKYGCKNAPCHSPEELRRRARECKENPNSCMSLEEAARILARRISNISPASRSQQL